MVLDPAFRFMLPLLVDRGPLCRILILGCGNSQLPAVLHSNGYRDVTCVDWSEIVVDMMREKYFHLEGLKCTYLAQPRGGRPPSSVKLAGADHGQALVVVVACVRPCVASLRSRRKRLGRHSGG